MPAESRVVVSKGRVLEAAADTNDGWALQNVSKLRISRASHDVFGDLDELPAARPVAGESQQVPKVGVRLGSDNFEGVVVSNMRDFKFFWDPLP